MDYDTYAMQREEQERGSQREEEAYLSGQARRRANFLDWAIRDYKRNGMCQNEAEKRVHEMEPLWEKIGKFSGMSDSWEKK